MALRYEFGIDTGQCPLQVSVTADGSPFTVAFTVETLAHTDISSLLGGDYTEFAAAFQSALDSGNSGAGGANTFTVVYSATTGYTITPSAGTMSLSFSTVTPAADGARMQLWLGFQADQGAASSHVSDARPGFLYRPAIQCRSDSTDEFEPDDITAEAVADDGTAFQISKDTAEVWWNWSQVAEQDSPSTPYTLSGVGQHVHSRFATALVPWSLQDAFKHTRAGKPPIAVFEDAGTFIHEMRSEGTPFKPLRFGGTDIDLWQTRWSTRYLGSL